MYTPTKFNNRFKSLIKRISYLYKPEEIESFLKELFTRRELEIILTRLAIIKMIDEGRSQREIATVLHTNIATITRVSKQLKQVRNKW